MFETAKTIAASCSPNDIAQFIQIINNLRVIKGIIIKKPDLQNLNCDASHNPRLTQKFQIYNGHFVQKNYPYKLHSCKRCTVESLARQCSCVVLPDPETVKELKPMVDKYIQKLLKNGDDFPTIEQFFNTYTGMQKRLYIEAYQSYNDGKKYNSKAMKMHTKIDEKIKIAYADGAKAKVKARNITAQNDICKVLMGPLISHISNIQKQMDHGFGSGITHEDRCIKFARWNKKWTKTRILCLDGSAFDSTQHTALLEAIDERIYRAIFDKYINEIALYCKPEDLLTIITTWDQLVTSGKAEKRWQYLIHGTQATGKMNTSQGNTTRSLFYTRFIALKAGISSKDFRVEASGDDTIIFIRDDLADKYINAAWQYVYAKDETKETPFGLGQIAKKFDIYTKITGVEYLSCHLVENYDDEIMMIRKVDRFLQLNGWTMNNPKLNRGKQKLYNQMLIRGEAINILSYCNDLRIFQTVAKNMLRFAGSAEACTKDLNKWVDRTDTRQLRFNEQYEEMLFEIYGIDKTDIDVFCKTVDNTKSMYAEMSFELIDKLERVHDVDKYMQTEGYIFRASDYDVIDIRGKTIIYHEKNGKSENHNDIIKK